MSDIDLFIDFAIFDNTTTRGLKDKCQMHEKRSLIP
jgi:hypothetical protein